MKSLFHAGLVFALCAEVTGCAGTGTSSLTSATALLSGTRTVSGRDLRDAIAIGRSTKADLIAALGKTTVISFDSGFEVWVYQYSGDNLPGETAADAKSAERNRAGSDPGTAAGGEFVVLFAPSGVVTKTRIRPAPPRSAATAR